MSEVLMPSAESSRQERLLRLKKLLKKKAENALNFPLSFSQQHLWTLDRLDPLNAAYNIPIAIRLRGALELDALNRTLFELIQRHESLRTKFVMVDDQPRQIVEAVKPQSLVVVDLTHLEETERDAEATARASVEASRPFRLDQSPLLRLSLLRFSTTDHVLIVVMHHIISDEWSLSVLFREIALRYQAFRAGEPSPMEPLPIQYADYSVWQRERLQGENQQRLLDYWKGRMQDLTPLELPTDMARSSFSAESDGSVEIRLTSALVGQLRYLGRCENSTLYMTLLSSLSVLLNRYSGQDDLTIGSPIAGRLGKETEGLIGFFVNSLVMRLNLEGNPTFRDLLQQTRTNVLDAFEHQELPFQCLVDAINPQRDTNRNPLFQVMFTLQNVQWPDLNVAGLSFTVIPLESGPSKFDLSFTMREDRDGLTIDASYRSALFRAPTIQRMLKHFRVLLEAIVADPDLPISQLPLLTEAERRQLLIEWNNTAHDFPIDVCAHELFEQQVERTPDACALIDDQRAWSYRELDQQANQLAHDLQRRGVGPDKLVVVRLSRRGEWVVSLLAILKAGAAYLPLETDLPSDRLQFTLKDAGVEVVLTEKAFCGDLPPDLKHVICLDSDTEIFSGEPVEAPACEATSQNLAYVIYTSGSTGLPKGVMIEHRALVSYTHAATALYGISSTDRVLQFAAASFDAHVEELFPCLTHGGTLFLRNDEMLDCSTFLQRCQEWKLTFVTLPTGFWHELVLAIADEGLAVPSTLRVLVIGGEKAIPERVSDWFQHVGNQVRLMNTYGPTETTVIATAAELSRVDGREKRVPIGRPLGNMRVYVLDRGLQPVPVGVSGELYIGGESLARGYLNRSELTEKCFLPDPFTTNAGARMYKTGDVVSWRTDGRIEFIGRTDHQVKLRGFRIEPGEIEQVLRRHPQLADVAVVVRERSPGDLQLVAYLTARQDEAPAVAEIRDFLRSQLPEFMIPAAFVVLESMPLTASGKLNRKALPDPDLSGVGTVPGSEFVAPRTPAEQQLAAIWSELLNVEQIGAYDNFFDLGGNSLLGIRSIPRIRKAFSIDLPVSKIFISPTLNELAEEIVAMQAAPRLPEMPPIVSVPRDGNLPASFAQEPFWFVQQISPSSNDLNMHAAIKLTGPLDVDALRETVNEIVRRHETLRTRFALSESGALMQVIVPKVQVDLPVEDLREWPAAHRNEEIARRSRHQASQPFDLSQAPLLRVSLLRHGDAEHTLLVTTHHIICDGWSLDLLGYEVSRIYDARLAGHHSPLPELPVQYVDHAVWQRNYLQGDALESLMGYWRQKLEGLTPLDLPTDRPRGLSAPSRQMRLDFQISNRIKNRLGQLCSDEGITPHVLMLAAFQLLLHRYSDSDDIAVGSISANRRQPEIQGMIGLFINNLVMRNDLSGDPAFRELLARVAKTAVEAYDHQEMRFELLAKELQPGHDLAKQPLVQVLFGYQQSSRKEEVEIFGGLTAETQETDAAWEAAEDYDLALSVDDEDQGFHCQFAYPTRLFNDETIARMATHFQTLLESIAANPDRQISQLPLLTERERERVLIDFNKTQVDFLDQGCVHQLFERQVQRAPEAVALVFENQSQSYLQLNTRANQIARYLVGLSVGPEVIVGICLRPSLELGASILGVLKAGGAYLPLDPDDLRERLDYFVADTRPAVILTTANLADQFSALDARVVCVDSDSPMISLESEDDLPCLVTAENAVCVLYTSGSSGKPKAAVNLHRGVRNYLLWKQRQLGLCATDNVLFTTPLSFDVSVEEFFDALCCGGRVVIAKPGSQSEPNYLVQLIRREGVTTACFVPSVLRFLLEEQDFAQCHSLKSVFCGGEALTPDLMEAFLQHSKAELYNVYGPTEASMGVTVWKCHLNYERDVIPIGQPISNVRVYILDSERNPVPIGVAGELYIGGVAVARGYLNRPELNALHFIPDPFSGIAGDLLYNTGDRCCWLPDGNIEFMGRRDGQVKIQGARIELGEVEVAINRCPNVAQAAVTVRQSSPDYKYLAAYVVPRGCRIETADARKDFVKELRQFLKSVVPDYMIPNAFEIMDVLPKLSSGKVNRRALPAVASPEKSVRRYVAPHAGLEQQLAAIWSEVLRYDRVGRYDNFFDLGGHSLLAVRLISKVRTAFSINVPVVAIFASPTIAELAEKITAAQALDEQSVAAPYTSNGSPASNAEAHDLWSRQRGESMDGDENIPIVEELIRSLSQTVPQGGKLLVPLEVSSPGTPVFLIHGLGGHVASFIPLARILKTHHSVYGLMGKGVGPSEEPHRSIEEMASCYLNEILAVQPYGPYLLAGWSMGGLIALETANQLRRCGAEVSLVALFDTHLSSESERFEIDDQPVMKWLVPHLDLSMNALEKLPLEQQWERIAERANLADGVGAVEIRRMAEVCGAHMKAYRSYRPQPYEGPVVLFSADSDDHDLDPSWSAICPNLQAESVPGNHYSMLRKPNVETLAERLDRYLAKVVQRERGGTQP